MSTYSIGAVVYDSGVGALVTLPDSVATGVPKAAVKTTPPGSVNFTGCPAGGIQYAMAQQTTFFPTKQDQSTGTPYVIDNERSDPARGLIYTRPLLP